MVNRDIKKAIKFRVWYEGRFHYWGFIGETFIEPPCIDGECADLIERKSQQYTSIKDRCGREIYAGDIIDISSFGIRHKKYYIISSVFGFGEDIGFACNFWSNHDYEVIGNIYENPEILSLAVR